MDYTQEQLVALAENIKDLDDQRKALVAEIKEAKDIFCEEHNTKKRPLNSAIKNYFAWLKDRSKWLEEVNETDQLIDVMTGEKVVPEPN
jgi:tRNA A37 N6-isopentenylltransferase MiaA